ncbi:MAG: hypothetical protein IJZ19_07005 [Lentisphaeria bacterium]|nr:hypothetical protein [Lentisphaeria bacterium]
MRVLCCILLFLFLPGCAALKEASKSIAIEIDWQGVFEAASAYFTH